MPCRVTKLALVGDAKVGKSSLLRRFVDNTFSTSYTSTIGIDYTWKSVEDEDDETNNHHRYLIWDTAGQERLKPSYEWFNYWPVDGLMLVYDCTDEQSFLHIQEYFKHSQQHGGSCKILLVGNKCDLLIEKVIPSSSGKALADSLGIPFLETSAKEFVNVQEAFAMVAAQRRGSKQSQQTPMNKMGCFSFKHH